MISMTLLSSLLSARFKIAPERITPDASFDDLGLDSLSQLELALTVEKATGKKISDEQIAEIANLNDLLLVLNQA